METQLLIDEARGFLDKKVEASAMSAAKYYIESSIELESWITKALIFSESIQNEDIKERFIHSVKKIPGNDTKYIESAIGILEVLK
ncbi:hypothetical protein EVU91_01305 [Macrococcoides bohemicum]|uniref:hypothetical protein n=1 Tax=Macrococcoides bohemicum TaxID=1903056 RepID=UPI001059C892|nr:hypothetical protein [Macrococcus bohemicus]TDL40555.1 hypothetical protein EVU91_01305 [Macrococcus bohemicus]